MGFILLLALSACRSPNSEYPVADLIARLSFAKISPDDSLAVRATADGRLLCESGSSLRYTLPRCSDAVLRLLFDPDAGNSSLTVRWEDGNEMVVYNSPDPIELEIGERDQTWHVEIQANSKRAVLREARIIDRMRTAVSAAYRDGSAVPNVILIIIDTLRADHLGCYGAVEPKTTALDSIASRGILYESATSQANGTLPSISSLLTGVYPYMHGIYSNDVRLDAQWETIPEVLKRAGYTTGAFVGAFHLNPRISGYGRGFDFYARCRRSQRRGEEVVNDALEWLDAHRHDRFFALVHMFDPHTPYQPPKAFQYNYYSGDPRDPDNKTMKKAWFPPAKQEYIRSWLGGITDIEWPLAQYKSEVEYASVQTGRVMEWIVDAGLSDQTIVIVTADHGESLTEHGIFFEHAGLYQEAINVPLIVSFPGILEEGLRIESPVENFSIFPTILNVLNVRIPNQVSAPPLPLVRGGVASPEIISEAGFEQAIMVRRSDLKYILNTKRSYFTPGEEELYDLSVDPREEVNLVTENATVSHNLDVIAGAIEAKREMVREHRTILINDDDRERLRALGYVE